MTTVLIADHPPIIVPLAIFPATLDVLEAVDVDLTEHHETVDVGPIDGRYLRFMAPDLLVAVDQARRVLGLIEDAVLDARQEAMEAERHDCPCGTRLEADEISCGSPRCDHLVAQEMSL